jgi:glutamyl-tRNA synthetase
VTPAVRVRIAPSPTGYFHVGSARTALYNWCVARRAGGTFILRIEDTDRERHQESQYAGIIEALRWLEIDWDEGPYRQSERGRLYADAIDRLWEAHHLYACDCTREEVVERTKDNLIPGYDGHCRHRGLERGPGRALRFAVPDDGVTVVTDVIRGEVEFANRTIEDFVVARSNGEALFVLAVVVDDREMSISHVIRGEEHLSTTPKGILLWEALNGSAAVGPSDGAMSSPCELPVFAHLPFLVNDKRQKISKRRDRVAIEDYRAQGFLPEAMGNYLALLGWSFPDGREVFTRSELVEAFGLEDVNNSPAFFDEQKLLHFNGLYIRALSTGEFTRRCRTWAAETGTHLAPREGSDHFTSPEWEFLAPLVQERVQVLAEVPFYVEFLGDVFTIDEMSWEKAVLRDTAAVGILGGARERLTELPPEQWMSAELKAVVERLASDVGRKLGKAQAPVRVATLGRTVGLPLFESLEVLGRDRVLGRLDQALERLSSSPGPAGPG